MNRELKAAIALLLVIVGLIAYFEMNSTEEVLGPVEPIEDVTLVPEPIEVEVKPQVELPVEPIAPKPPAVAKVVVPEPMPEPVVAPEPVVVNQDPILEKPVIDVVPEEPSDLIKVSPSIPSEYIVQKGDTVSGISEKVLGSIHFQKLLLNANPELQPHQLFEKIRLVMPNRNDLEVLADEVNSKRSLEGDYVIQKGDNLYKISKKLLGSTKYVKEIVNLNPNVDPRRLIVGSKIRLPKK